MSENYITEIDVLDEAKDNFLTYSSEVLTDRAIPAAEDGLLSAQRKILWTMEDYLKMSEKSKTKKCNAIVGSTLSTSYYHGDAACYGVLCKMSQEYLMRYPLIVGQGSLGTQENNDMFASSRYTEAKPSKYSDLMMIDFKKNVVPLKETYNGEFMEPVVLPSLFPNAIANGRQAIGISMSHGSLPHNLTEVCNAIVAYIKKGGLTIEEIMEHIKGPDFPLHNIVINARDVKAAFATGHSATSLKVRGHYTVKGQKIIFDTIPYRTYRNKIKEQIQKNVTELEKYIEDFDDESNLGQNKLVFTVKKGIDPEQAVLRLFALTDLQTTVSYNMNYIVNGTPKMCSMADLLKAYVEHQTNVLLKATTFDREKAAARAHILEGLLLIISNIDKAISLIKAAENKELAKNALINTFSLDATQAEAVLNMRLSSLTKLDKDKLLNELEEKKAIIARCDRILNEETFRNNVLIEKIEDMKAKYGDARRTELLNLEIPKDKEEAAVVPTDVVVVSTESGLIKKIPTTSFKVQRRGTKGFKSIDDIPLTTIKTNTVDTFMFFSNKGVVYKILVDKIPTGTNTTKGTPISSLINMGEDEKIIAISSLHKKTMPKYVIFITEKGMIKKSYLEEYLKLRRGTGTKAIKLQEGDRLIKILFQDEEDLLLLSKKGFALRTKSTSISTMGRIAMGVKGMKLTEGDSVVSAMSIHKEDDYVAIFEHNGMCKKVKLTEFPMQLRYTRGVIAASDEIAGAAMVDDKDNIAIFGTPNNVSIPVKDISLLSRHAMGVRAIKAGTINSITKL